MEHYFDGLIEFNTETEFNSFLNKLDGDQSILILEIALSYAQKQGIFSIGESSVIFHSLLKLKEQIKDNEAKKE